MNRMKTAAIAAGIAASGLMGGLVGAAISGGTIALNGTAAAATTTTAATGATGASGATAAPHTPNEDPTHEAGESAAREAAENNGTATYGPPPSSTAPSQ